MTYNVFSLIPLYNEDMSKENKEKYVNAGIFCESTIDKSVGLVYPEYKVLELKEKFKEENIEEKIRTNPLLRSVAEVLNRFSRKEEFPLLVKQREVKKALEGFNRYELYVKKEVFNQFKQELHERDYTDYGV